MRALIVKTSSLGDILHAFPVLSYLRGRGFCVDWVVERPFSELVKAHPDIDQVLEVDTKRWRKQPFARETRRELRLWRAALRRQHYDVLFDLQGNLKSAFVTQQARACEKVGFGWRTVPEWPNLLVTRRRFNPPVGKNIREDYLYLVQAYFKDEQPFVVTGVELRVTELVGFEAPGFQLLVCPGSAWPNKQLPEESLIRLICQRWPTAKLSWVWGNETELTLVQRCQRQLGGRILPRLSLPSLQRLMSAADAVLAMDSLPLHLCGTTETPSFSLFGPSNADKYRPLGPQHRSIQGLCPYGQNFEKRCSRLRTCPTGACLKELTFSE